MASLDRLEMSGKSFAVYRMLFPSMPSSRLVNNPSVPLPPHRSVCLGASTLYLCGGDYPNGRPSSEVWKYEQKLDTWIQLSDMLTPRSELGLALIDGYLYACGGWNGEVRLNSIERYSIAENKWTNVGVSGCVCEHENDRS